MNKHRNGEVGFSILMRTGILPAEEKRMQAHMTQNRKPH